MNFFKSVILVFLYFMSLQAHAGYQKYNKVNDYTQEKNYYCAVTTVQMYSHWLGGSDASQDEIAQSEGVSLAKGLNINELADAIENYTSNWFSAYSTSSKDAFVKKIITENQSGNPVVVMVHTQYTDISKPPKPNKHYMLVDGFTLSSDSYNTDVINVLGLHINDPMWDYINKKSKFPEYVSVDGRYAFPVKVFMDEKASTYNNKYYLVED